MPTLDASVLHTEADGLETLKLTLGCRTQGARQPSRAQHGAEGRTALAGSIASPACSRRVVA